MTVQDIKKLVHYWADQVPDALETAHALFRSGKFHYCLFFCHLAAERMLKALVVNATKEHAPFTHNLVFLAGKADLDADADQLHLLESLNEWCLMARYPTSRKILETKATKNYAASLLKETENFIAWLQRR